MKQGQVDYLLATVKNRNLHTQNFFKIDNFCTYLYHKGIYFIAIYYLLVILKPFQMNF